MRAPENRFGLRHATLTLVAVPWVGLPLWLMLVNAMKPDAEAAVPSIALPKVWALAENVGIILDKGAYLTGLANSLIVTVPTVLVALLLGSMAAWSYARSSSRGLMATYYVTALSIVLPPAVIPTVFLVTKAGLTGSLAGYVLALIGTRVGVIVFLTTGYVRALPRDFEDAARIDGASRWQTYWHVILPLLRPVLFTAAVMTVINVWNDFLFALYMTKGAAQATLPLTLYNFANAGQYGIRWNLVFAHVLMTSLPLMIAYVALQRRILSGLTEGGVTG
jgi:raffinose/stachyose/melibiose transport system permease protein